MTEARSAELCGHTARSNGIRKTQWNSRWSCWIPNLRQPRFCSIHLLLHQSRRPAKHNLLFYQSRKPSRGQANTYPISVACIHLLFDQSSSQTLTQSQLPNLSGLLHLLLHQSRSQNVTQSRRPAKRSPPRFCCSLKQFN